MSTFRAAAAPATSIFRFASQPPTTRRCTHCLKAQRCPFSSFRPIRQDSKRPLMTESASYRPHTLEPAPVIPPRNADASSSLSAGESWPPATPWERKGGSDRAANEQKQREATSSTPLLASTPKQQQQQTTPSTTPKPTKPRSKLRARKAPITLTPLAVTQLHELFTGPSSQLIRIGVKNRGCSGLAYHLEYVTKPGSFDETVEQDGVKVLIDSKALFSIIGSEMDWVEDKLSARFVFRNPNVTESCGCGESFSIS